MKVIGRISEINRYPVKSFAGENLESSHIATYGLYGDRCYAFVDKTKEGWDSYVTARQIPEMLGFKASLIGEESANRFPNVLVESPDGRRFGWDTDLLNEIQTLAKPKLSMIEYSPENNLLAVDTASLLIITDSSLRRLEAIWGKRLDKRRFRANLVVELQDDADDESRWLGKRLFVGNVELGIDILCERCSMITFDPDTRDRDVSLLRTVNEELNLNFGVYASVKKAGDIHLDDAVLLVD